MLVAIGSQHILDFDDRGRGALKGIAAAGVVLMAGHAGDGVIQHYGNHVSLIVENLGGTGHAAVEKGGVPQNAKDLFSSLSGDLKGLGHAHANGESAAHADTGIYGAQRRRCAQGVAADVAGNNKVFSFGHGVEESPMGAARTQRRRPGHRRYRQLLDLRLDAEYHLPQPLGIQLIETADQLLSGAEDASGLDLFLHKGFQFFDDVQLFHL